jgi:hypothetical protein
MCSSSVHTLGGADGETEDAWEGGGKSVVGFVKKLMGLLERSAAGAALRRG